VIQQGQVFKLKARAGRMAGVAVVAPGDDTTTWYRDESAWCTLVGEGWPHALAEPAGAPRPPELRVQAIGSKRLS
jgi:hypothetical protein